MVEFNLDPSILILVASEIHRSQLPNEAIAVSEIGAVGKLKGRRKEQRKVLIFSLCHCLLAQGLIL